MKVLTDNLYQIISSPLPEAELAFMPQDSEYLQFLKRYNGAYSFNGALHLYGFDAAKDWHDILLINAKVQKAYELFNFSKTFFCFGCDLFFNQFGYYKGDVVMLDIYAGELTILAPSFSEWVTLLKEEGDYYSAFPLLVKWTNERGKLDNGERLAATIPFVVGGEYKIENLYPLRQDKLLAFASFFANEIKDRPDGSKKTIRTK